MKELNASAQLFKLKVSIAIGMCLKNKPHQAWLISAFEMA